MHKFTIKNVFSEITASIYSENADKTSDVVYGEVSASGFEGYSQIPKLKSMISSNGGLFMGIDPDRTNPRDLRCALGGSGFKFLDGIPFELAVKGEFPPLASRPEGILS